MPSFSVLLTDPAMITKLQEQARIAADRKLQRTTLAGAVLMNHNITCQYEEFCSNI